MLAKLTVSITLLTVAFNFKPVSGGRPFDGLTNWLSHQFKLVEPQISASEEKAPWFCHDLDCPPYKVLNHSDGYETREYAPGTWALTQVEGRLYEPSVGVGFQRLFAYISGENEDGTKIPMTVPVLAYVQPGQGTFAKSNYTVGFYLPFALQEKWPAPKNKDIIVSKAAKDKVYVSQFGGFLVDEITLAAKVEALRTAVIANGETFLDDGSYITDTYDPPYRLQHRHNEVQLPSTSYSMFKALASSR